MPVPPRVPLRKRLLFGAVIALLSVVVFFGALEGILRLSGFGHSPRFFRTVRDAEGRAWIRENRDFTLTYFPPALVRRPPAFRLPAEKAPGTYRIFVLGSSAAMGDPEPSFSLARLLDAMLRDAYPEIKFEVVNAAITAINSQVVRAIAADCAQLAPDLFIVYEGNNEVIGPFGPAAVLAPFLRSSRAVRLVIGLKSTRTGQALGALARALGAGTPVPADWGGMGMFLEQAIPASDPRLADVRARFAGNLRAIVAAGDRAGARTLLCTVLTNQRDFAPFLSEHRADRSTDEVRRWDEAFAAGNRALGEGEAARAEQQYRIAWALDDTHAELAFRLGRVCLAQQRPADAEVFLQRALDLDCLRFRTDSALNQTIRDTAAAQSASAMLVDLATELAARSPGGILGDELLYEHVHLTFRGTWETARRLFVDIGAELVRRGHASAPVAEPFPVDEARRRLAYTTYEQAMIVQELLQRFTAPPFTAQSDQAQRVAAWQERAAAARQLLEQDKNLAWQSTIYEQAIATAPGDWVLLRNFGMALVAGHEPARAVPWLEQARAIIDDDPDTLFALGTALRAIQREADAAAIFARLRELEPRYPGLPPADAAP